VDVPEGGEGGCSIADRHLRRHKQADRSVDRKEDRETGRQMISWRNTSDVWWPRKQQWGYFANKDRMPGDLVLLGSREWSGVEDIWIENAPRECN